MPNTPNITKIQNNINLDYAKLRSNFSRYNLNLGLVFGFLIGAELAQKCPSKRDLEACSFFNWIHLETDGESILDDDLKQILESIKLNLQQEIFFDFSLIFGIEYKPDNFYLSYLSDFCHQIFCVFYVMSNDLKDASEETKSNGKAIEQLDKIISQINNNNEIIDANDLGMLDASLNQIIHIIFQSKW